MLKNLPKTSHNQLVCEANFLRWNMKTIAFQGELGAYSHEACMSVRSSCDVLPCKSFEEVITTVKTA